MKIVIIVIGIFIALGIIFIISLGVYQFRKPIEQEKEDKLP